MSNNCLLHVCNGMSNIKFHIRHLEQNFSIDKVVAIDALLVSWQISITLLFIHVHFLQKPHISLSIPTIKYNRT